VSDVIVIGGGPAGLACAIELRRRGVRVTVLEREQQAGGIPRHCAHQGFGVRDLHRLLSGPSYARRYIALARNTGVDLQVEAMVTGWTADGALRVTCRDGADELRASAIVLATGCRERPRSARLVPGSRPDGVMTTGQLQQLTERGAVVGTRAVVVGAEHVSFSALLTLAHAGVRVAAMTTPLPRHQSLPGAGRAAAVRYRVPLWTRTDVVEIRGARRVEEVEVRNLDTGGARSVPCDTVVFTGDWVPDHELAVSAGVELDAGTRGPSVDAELRTTRLGVFGAGNVLQGAEPADVAALSGRHAAIAVARWLADGATWPERIRVVCRPPLQWISPNAVTGGPSPLGGAFALRSTVFLGRSEVLVRQDDRVLWRGHVRGFVPGRSRRLTAGWLTRVNHSGGQIEVSAH
jgi:thioredoxin reductase